MSQNKKTESTSLLPNTLTNTVDTLSHELDGQDLGVGTYKITYELCNAVAKHNGQGLCIIPCPTGAGKTHASAELCVNILKEFKRRENLPNAKKKSRPYSSIDRVVYVTPQKEGRNSFRNSIFKIAKSQHLSKSELEYIKNNVYVISSNVDAALDFYDKYTQDPNYLDTNMLSDMQEFKTLLEYASDYKEACINGKSNSSSKFNEFCKKEKDFRKEIKKRFNDEYCNYCKKFKSKNEEEKAPDKPTFYENSPEWHFLEKLYPSINERKKKVYCLTDIKFIYSQDTIIDGHINFTNSSDPYLKNAMFIFDEIDTIKSNMLQELTRKAINSTIENIRFIKQVESSSHYDKENRTGFNDASPNILYTPVKTSGQNFIYSPKESLNIMSRLANNVYSKMNLNYHIRIDENSKENNAFIFSMPGINLVKQSKYTYYKVLDNEKTLLVYNSKNKRSLENNNLLNYLFASTRGAAHSIMLFLYDIAYNYSKNKYNYISEHSEFDATCSVLVNLGLAQPNTEYCYNLANTILALGRGNCFSFNTCIAKTKNLDKFLNPKTDLSLYAHGLDIIQLKEGRRHAEDAIIKPYSLKTTPESIFARRALTNKVIGMSATSTIETIKNLDLEYLGSILRGNLYIPSGEILQTILNQNDKQITQNKSLYDVKTETYINESADVEETIKALVSDKKAKYDIYRTFPITDEHYKMELYRICLYFKNCVKRYQEGKGNANMLFLNRCIKPERMDPNQHFSQETIEKVFKIILKDMEVEKTEDFIDGCTYVRASCWDEAMKDIDDRFKNKSYDNLPFIFTITTYNSCGVGKNAQPKLSKKLINDLVKQDKMVITNPNFSKSETDYDSIYLEKPTHTLTWNPSNSGDELIKKQNMLLGSYEQAELFNRGELNRSDAVDNIKRILNHGSLEYTKIPSAKAETSKVLIQAIGRIARTTNKRKEVYIALNEVIAQRADLDIIRNLPTTYESQRVFETLSNELEEKDALTEMNRAQRKIANSTSSLYHYLRNRYLTQFALNRHPAQHIVEEYKKVNEFLLKHPQPISNDEIALLDEDPSMPLTSTYTYFETADECLDVEVLKKNQGLYEDDYIFFDPEDREDFINKYNKYSLFSIGPKAARIDTLMNVQVVSDYFKDNGYATELKPSKYHLLPPFFYMYLGRIGEKTFEAICKEYNIEIEELDTNIFETFDYRIKGTDIYIDVKNWHETQKVDADAMVKKTVKKIDKCGASSAIYINILADKSKYRIFEQPDPSQEVYTTPALIDEKTCRINTDCIQWLKNFIETHR